LLSLSSSIVRSEYGKTNILMKQIRETLALPESFDNETKLKQQPTTEKSNAIKNNEQ
jgi:hypothetical protein